MLSAFCEKNIFKNT